MGNSRADSRNVLVVVALPSEFEGESEWERAARGDGGGWNKRVDVDSGRDEVGIGGGLKGGRGGGGNDVLDRPVPESAASGDMIKSKDEQPTASARLTRRLGSGSGSGSTEKDGMGLTRDFVKLYIPGG